jgi:tetratricopeptide (TPR) repeat protein
MRTICCDRKAKGAALFFSREKWETKKVGEDGSCYDLLDRILLIATIVAIASFLLREIHDADTWWQVAIGRDILAQLTIPRYDHFAAAAMGRSYHDSHWLFQVLLAFADRMAGMRGVGGVMVALWGMSFFFCYRAMRHRLFPAACCILVFCAAMACSDRFTPRPDVVTCLMVILFYLRLQKGKYSSAADLAVLFLLQVIWSNSHGLFVIGPFMAGCYLLVAAVNRWRGDKAPDLPAAALLVALLAAATLVTPFGFGGWSYALLLMKEAGPTAPEVFKTLPELIPSFSAQVRSFPDVWFFGFLLLAVVVTSVPVFLKRRVPYARMLIVAAFGIVAVSARRNIPLFALTAAPLLAEYIRICLPRLILPAAVKGITVVSLLMAIWLPLSGRYYLFLNYPIRVGLGTSSSSFPDELPAFLRRISFHGQIYNSNSLGGFSLYNGFLPLIDGRWEVYDEKVLTAIFQTPFDPQAWEWLVTTYGIRGVLLSHESTEAQGLLPKLHNDHRWRLVYFDNAASFWMPADGETSPPSVDFAVTTSHLRLRRVEDYLKLAIFFRLIDAPESALFYFEKALPFGEKREAILEKIGLVQIDLGRAAEAEKTFTALLQLDGKNIAALNELAFFAYNRGDLKKAESYLRQAMAVKPDDASIKENYELISNTIRRGTGHGP